MSDCTLIIRTTGRRPVLLKQAIQSAIGQNCGKLQIVVVEDGGEASRELVQSLAAPADSSLLYLPVPPVGRSAVANAGLTATKGRFVGFLDDDDVLLPLHCQALLSVLQKHSEAPAAFASWYEVGRDAEIPDMFPDMFLPSPRWRRVTAPAFSRPALLLANQFPIQAVMFRREAALKAGDFDGSLPALEDWDLWLRLSRQGEFRRTESFTSVCRVAADRDEQAERLQMHAAAWRSLMAKHEGTDFHIRGGEIPTFLDYLREKPERHIAFRDLLGAVWRIARRKIYRDGH